MQRSLAVPQRAFSNCAALRTCACKPQWAPVYSRSRHVARAQSKDDEPEKQPGGFRHPELDADDLPSSSGLSIPSLPLSGAETDWRAFR